MLYFFIIAFLTEIQAALTKGIWHNNMPGLHVFTVIEFLAFSTFYYLQMQESSRLRHFILINIALHIIVALCDALYINGIFKPNDVSRGYSSAFIALYSLINLYRLYQNDEPLYIWEYPMFWICIGALIYFGGGLLYFMMKNYLLKVNPGIEWLTNLSHVSLNFIANCLYAQAFRCFRKK